MTRWERRDVLTSERRLRIVEKQLDNLERGIRMQNNRPGPVRHDLIAGMQARYAVLAAELAQLKEEAA